MTLDALDIIHGAVLGGVAGFISQRAAIVQIKARTDDASKSSAVKKPLFTILWALFAAMIAAGLFAADIGTIQKFEYLLYTAAALDIMIVDIAIRKIPNSTLLAMLITRFVTAAALAISGEPIGSLLLFSAVGFVIGGILFIIPKFFRIPVGAGDIKLCSVIGFCIGFSGFVQSMVIMACGMLIYLLYLLATKRGTIKTVTCMGPFLAGGMIVTMAVPLKAIFMQFLF